MIPPSSPPYTPRCQRHRYNSLKAHWVIRTTALVSSIVLNRGGVLSIIADCLTNRAFAYIAISPSHSDCVETILQTLRAISYNQILPCAVCSGIFLERFIPVLVRCPPIARRTKSRAINQYGRPSAVAIPYYNIILRSKHGCIVEKKNTHKTFVYNSCERTM